MDYNRDWLRAQISSYLHDDSLSLEIDTFIDIGAKRASQVLQCFEMEAELTRSAGDADNFIPLASTVRSVLGVQWQNFQGNYINLRSVPRHNAGLYKGTGTPAVYYIESRRIYMVPTADADYKAQVLQEVEIPADGTTEVDALTAYPFVFLNAAMAEAYDWKQNQEMAARYEQKWWGEAEKVMEIYISERGGEALAMRAM